MRNQRVARRAAPAVASGARIAWRLAPGPRPAPAVTRRPLALGDRSAWVYEPDARPVVGAYVVVQGVHYLGPDDPRSDRFCRGLADAGLLVVAPRLPASLRLLVARSTVDDLALFFAETTRLAADRGVGAPAIFSISFGSAPALALAARDDARPSGVVVFGGFCDFLATITFLVDGSTSLDGERITMPHDPLNTPVVFLNLLAYLDGVVDPDALAAAYRAAVHATWGRPELHDAAIRRRAVAVFGERLASRDRELFEVACGLRAGAARELSRARDAAGDAFSFMDAAPSLARLRAPLAVVHGVGDDVIPYPEAIKLCAALRPGHPHRLLLTGAFSHTAHALPRPRDLFAEARTLVAIARSLALAPAGRLP